MEFASILLLSIAGASDSFLIGFNYGVKQVRIGRISNLFISAICFAGTLFSMLCGRCLGGFLTPGCGGVIGGMALLLCGGVMLCAAAKPEGKGKEGPLADPVLVDKDMSKVIELRESLLIGVLLALNNIGMGIGAGMAGFSPFITPFVCAAVSFLFIGTGCLLGGLIKSLRLCRLLEAASAGLVLLVGALQLAG